MLLEAQRDTRPVLFYDGECGLCDRTVQTVLDLDTQGRLRLAPLQGETARRVLLRHGRDPEPAGGFKTMIFCRGLDTEREQLLEESRAVLAIGRELGGRYETLVRFAELVPSDVRNVLYRLIAKNRHRFFPAPEACRLPTPEVRARFLP